MFKKAVAASVMALMVVPATAAVASAAEAADTNVTERIECLFRVYVWEGGEQGLDCLV